LLILSPFDDTQTRITAEASVTRNCFVAALAERVFVAYAEPNGKLEALCREVIVWGKPLSTFAENAHLVALGAKAVTANWGLLRRNPSTPLRSAQDGSSQ